MGTAWLTLRNMSKHHDGIDVGMFFGLGVDGFGICARFHAIQFNTLQQYGATTDTSFGMFGGFGGGQFWNRQIHHDSIHDAGGVGIWIGARSFTPSSTA